MESLQQQSYKIFVESLSNHDQFKIMDRIEESLTNKVRDWIKFFNDTVAKLGYNESFKAYLTDYNWAFTAEHNKYSYYGSLTCTADNGYHLKFYMIQKQLYITVWRCPHGKGEWDVEPTLCNINEICKKFDDIKGLKEVLELFVDTHPLSK